MTKLERIEADIRALDPQDVRRLAEWLDEWLAGQWEAQIARDADAGRLDALAEKARDAHKAGRTRPL